MWIPFPRVSWGRPTLSAEEEQQARIDAKLRAIERQGAGSVLFAHGLAYLLVVAFSAGALITLAGDAINHFITQAQQGVFDFPSFVSFVVSFVLVFAMDTAMMIAAFHVRMLNQRQQEGAWKHMVVIVVVSLVESATYLDMGYLYDHPASWVTWAILGVRALLSPGIAVYLSLSRTLPVTARDINTQVENVTGRGVLVEMTRIADDPDATTERKVALYRASAVMDGADKSRLDAIIEAERATRDGAVSPSTASPLGLQGIHALPTQHLTPPAPQQQKQTQQAAPLSRHDQRRAQLAESMYTDLDEYDLSNADEVTDAPDAPADDFGEWGDDGDDSFARRSHPTRPRGVSLSNQVATRQRAQAAHMAPRGAELTVREFMLPDLPPSRYEEPDDSDQCRAVFRVLDTDDSLTNEEVRDRARVSLGTVKVYRPLWKERQKNSGKGKKKGAPKTRELPAVKPDALASTR